LATVFRHKPTTENRQMITLTFAQKKALLVNPQDKSWKTTRYAITNASGILAIVYANDEGEALDEAVDGDKLNGEMMSEEDHAEYSAKGWDDSFCYAGNAGEPIWTEYLGISTI